MPRWGWSLELSSQSPSQSRVRVYPPHPHKWLRKERMSHSSSLRSLASVGAPPHSGRISMFWRHLPPSSAPTPRASLRAGRDCLRTAAGFSSQGSPPPTPPPPWKTQFRVVLILYAFSNMIMVYSLGFKPVAFVKLGAIPPPPPMVFPLTPLQALAVGLVLYLVMPRFFSEEVRKILKPHWIFAAGLVLAFFVFGYFCVFPVPFDVGEGIKTSKGLQF